MTAIPTDSEFFSAFDFAPVLALPDGYEVYDFSSGYDPDRARASAYGVGKYNERRPGMYSTELFHSFDEPRDIHVGIDLAAPVGTAVFAFMDGIVWMSGINSQEGDYGGTIITEHWLGSHQIWALYGHLSHDSAKQRQSGQKVRRGEVLAKIGDRDENGGWNPHLHFQLSWERPLRCDLPGTVNASQLEEALRKYPDPRLVLGPLY